MVEGAISRRRMLTHLIVYEVRREHAGTVLGVAWAVLQPVSLLACYFFLFAVLRVPENAPHGPLGKVAVILSGVVPWLFFMRCFSNGLGSLNNHASLVKQINFPIGVLPFVTVGVFLIDFCVGLCLLLIVVIIQGWVGWATLMAIPMTIVMAAFLCGLAALLAPLGVMLKDIHNLLPMIVRLGLFVSPVLYIPGTIPQRFHWIMYANPMTYFIGLLRYATFGTQYVAVKTNEVTPINLLPPLPSLGIACGCALVLGTIAYLNWGFVRRVAVDYL
jgi:lipopolysaccharide transport system permease protein